jgi:hypothetical protein
MKEISRRGFLADTARYAAGLLLLGLPISQGCGDSDTPRKPASSYVQSAYDERLDALLGEYSRTQAGSEAEREAYLKRAKDAFKLNQFLDVCYQPKKSNKSDWIMATWPAVMTEKGIAFSVVVAPQLVGYDSVCLVFNDAFERTYHDFMSTLVDHEHKHAEIWKRGIDGYDMNRITTAAKNSDSVTDLFCAMSEIVACHNQIKNGKFSEKMSDVMTKNTLDLYSDAIGVVERLSGSAFAEKISKSWPIR